MECLPLLSSKLLSALFVRTSCSTDESAGCMTVSLYWFKRVVPATSLAFFLFIKVVGYRQS